MSASLDLNKLPQTPLGFNSEPGTPMSGISTVAIKDGHEGIRHHRHNQNRRNQSTSSAGDSGTPTSADRVAQLGGIIGVPAAVIASQDGTPGTGYFDRVSGWRRELQPGEENGQTPGNTLGNDAGLTPLGNATPGGDSGIEGLSDDSPMQAYTPFEDGENDQSTASSLRNQNSSSTEPNSIYLNNCNPHLSALLRNNSTVLSQSSTTTNTSNSPASGIPQTPLSAPSPASTVTTNSVRNAKAQAKMLGPVTHDEGIVDTTLVGAPRNVDGGQSTVTGATSQMQEMDFRENSDREHRAPNGASEEGRRF
ncbi:hypothetical protein DFH27DRAFT_207661 [Peziza echinospora]|nr:hypothetical protein DFH27DRAFT_207661 [Peziza echinospora]